LRVSAQPPQGGVRVEEKPHSHVLFEVVQGLVEVVGHPDLSARRSRFQRLGVIENGNELEQGFVVTAS
jgi:hypothetical protein